MVLKTFESDDQIYQKFKIICIRDDLGIGETLNGLIEKFVKEKEPKPKNLQEWMEKKDTIHVPDFFDDWGIWREYMGRSFEILDKCQTQISILSRTSDEVRRVLVSLEKKGLDNIIKLKPKQNQLLNRFF